MRPFLVLIHRWFGLAAAAFLFIAGATGAVIAWDGELDAWLNPHLFNARSEGPPLSVFELAQRVEQADPRVRVRSMPLSIEPGRTLMVWVQPRVDVRTGQLFEPGYNQVWVDPATGHVLGQRQWGEASLSREHLLPFLYKLHYSMHLPEFSGVDIGVWLMGLMAMGWVLDTLIAMWLSFPTRGAWRRSLAFRWREGGHRFTFDLHRSGGVWLFVLVLMLAVTAVSMNLQREVVRPLVSLLSTLTPSPFDSRVPGPPHRPLEPLVSADSAVSLAQAQARRLGLTAPPGALSLSTDVGVWSVAFFEPGRAHAGLGAPWLYVDAHTGEPAGAEVPGAGSAGDIFLRAMFPLHSGRIAGLAGRVLITLLGVAVAGLSVTGVLIWLRKRRARQVVLARPLALARQT